MSEPQAGHNGQLKAIVDRVVNLEDQKKDLSKDIAEIYLEAKGGGLNPSRHPRDRTQEATGRQEG